MMSEKYPEAWKELENLGMKVRPNGLKSFEIDRKVLP